MGAYQAFCEQDPKKMKYKVLFATYNMEKVKEILPLLPQNVDLIILRDTGYPYKLAETGMTSYENAIQKAKSAYDYSGIPSFADDTGLMVTCLGGSPGIFSARYAGDSVNAAENIKKLLSEMKNCNDRSATFTTVIAYTDHAGTQYFEGSVRGTIADSPSGINGFGYDPVFIPEGHTRTFGEMSPGEKNSLSHRRKATEKFLASLRNSMLYRQNNPVE